MAIIALLGNVIGGAFCSMPAKAGSSDYPSELAGAMVICTEHGMQTLASGLGDEQQKPSKLCQLCLAAAGFAVVLAFAALGILIPLPTDRRIAFDFVPTFAGRLRRAGLGSRGPPLPA